jgi:hypothetical protein
MGRVFKGAEAKAQSTGYVGGAATFAGRGAFALLSSALKASSLTAADSKRVDSGSQVLWALEYPSHLTSYFLHPSLFR